MFRFLNIFCITTLTILGFVLGISSCTSGGGGSGRTPPISPVPVDISLTVASTRSNIVDANALSGEGEVGQGNAQRIGSDNTKIEKIKNMELEGGTLILTSNQSPLTVQQVTELEVDFEMWISAGETAHKNNPSVIAVGEPDLTWTAKTEQVTDNIYDFSQVIENFQEVTNNALDPVINGNYTAFVRLALKDVSGLVSENSSLSLQNLHLNVVASELPNNVTIIEPLSLVRKPEITDFEATPRVINKGEKSILRWWVAGEQPLKLTIDNGIGDVTDLIRFDVSPEQTTTYTLTVTNSQGSTSRKVTVIVVPEPTIVQTIKGHKGRVKSAVHSPKENLIAATAGSYIHIFNSSTGDLLRTFVGHNSQVSSLAFSSDGNKLASGSENSIIKIWQVSNGTLLRSLALGHTAQITSVAFSSDGKMFASGSKDRTVKLWEVTDGLPNQLPKHTLLGHTNVIEEIAFSPDSATLASGSFDKTVKLWKVSDGTKLRTLSHKGSVSSVAFSPDSNTLASGVAWPENVVKLWGVSDGTELHTLSGHFSGVEAVAFHPDGNILASANPGFIKLWQLSNDNFSLLRDIQDSLVVNSLQFSPDGETLIAGGDVRTKLWRLSDLTELHTLVGQGSNVASLDFSSSSKLASGSYDALLKLWQIKDDKELDKFQAPATLNSIMFNPAGNILAASYRFEANLWQVSNSGKLSKLHSLKKHQGLVRSVSFSPDGKTLASGSDDQTINLWEVATGKELGMLPKHTRPINVVAFSPKDNNILAFSSRLDTSIKVWDIDENKEISNFKGHEGRGGILALAFSPDGETLASSDHHTTIKLSRAEDGAELHTLSGHANNVFALTFSPDGSILASGGADNTVRLWVVGDGTELLKLSNHSDSIEALAFSPNGRYLAVGAGTIENISDVTIYGDPDDKAIFGGAP